MTSAVRTAATTRSRMAAGLLVFGAIGHALALSGHVDPGRGDELQVIAFGAVAAAQLFGAAALALGPAESRRRVVVLAGSAVLVGLWAVSRTVGLPYGPHSGDAEPVGALDAVTVVAQLGVVALLAPGGRRLRIPVGFAASLAVVVVGMTALHVGNGAGSVGATTHDREQPERRHGAADLHAHP